MQYIRTGLIAYADFSATRIATMLAARAGRHISDQKDCVRRTIASRPISGVPTYS